MLRREFAKILGAAATAAIVAPAVAQPGPRGRVLVVVSSAQILDLQDGRTYRTGFFLNELAVPAQAMRQAGFELVFANPQGNAATWDERSAAPGFFGGSAERLEDAKRFVQGLEGLRQPRKLAEIRAEGIGAYAAVFVPGGHAAMQDLPTDADLGAVLRAFHEARKITAAICHGPAALLSTLPDPAAFVAAMAAGDVNAAQRVAAGWIYAGYHMTAFTTSEERPVEARMLQGRVRYYPTEALAQAGARVVTGPDRRSLVVHDRTLITGQQPVSDAEFTEVVMRALQQRQASN